MKYITCVVCGKAKGYDPHKTHVPKTCSRRCGCIIGHKVRRANAQKLTERECPKCKKVCPLTLEYYSVAERNATGFYSWCRECCRNKQRALVKNSPEIIKLYKRTYSSNQRVRRFGVSGYLSRKLVDQLMNDQSGKCAYCQALLDKYHVDHITPLARGGTHELSNLCLACPSCNHSKWASTLEEWAIRRPDLNLEIQ